MSMASWLSQTFEVSEERIVSMANLEMVSRVQKETKSNSNGTKTSSVKGIEALSMKFDFRLNYAAGGRPKAEFDEWKALVGKSGAFYLAGELLGDYLLEEVKASDISMTNKGYWVDCKITVNFSEKEAASSKTGSSTGKSTAAGVSSGGGTAGTTSTDKGTPETLIKSLMGTKDKSDIRPTEERTLTAAKIAASSSDKEKIMTRSTDKKVIPSVTSNAKRST